MAQDRQSCLILMKKIETGYPGKGKYLQFNLTRSPNILGQTVFWGITPSIVPSGNVRWEEPSRALVSTLGLALHQQLVLMLTRDIGTMSPFPSVISQSQVNQGRCSGLQGTEISLPGLTNECSQPLGPALFLLRFIDSGFPFQYPSRQDSCQQPQSFLIHI